MGYYNDAGVTPKFLDGLPVKTQFKDPAKTLLASTGSGLMENITTSYEYGYYGTGLTYPLRTTKETLADPDMGNWSYTYDLAGNLVTQTDSRNTLITFDYDALNRKIKKTFPDASVAEYQYDGAGNGIGLLYKKSNTEGSTEFLSYDEMGRPLSEKRITGSAIVILDYAYDLPGRPSSKSVTKNNIPFKSLNYEFYPGTSLLKRVSDGNNNTLSEITLYSPQGKMEAVSFNGGKSVTTYSYFPLTGRLSTINAYTVPGGVNIIYKLYDYNKSGDITGLHDLKNDPPPKNWRQG